MALQQRLHKQKAVEGLPQSFTRPSTQPPNHHHSLHSPQAKALFLRIPLFASLEFFNTAPMQPWYQQLGALTLASAATARVTSCSAAEGLFLSRSSGSTPAMLHWSRGR